MHLDYQMRFYTVCLWRLLLLLFSIYPPCRARMRFNHLQRRTRTRFFTMWFILRAQCCWFSTLWPGLGFFLRPRHVTPHHAVISPSGFNLGDSFSLPHLLPFKLNQTRSWVTWRWHTTPCASSALHPVDLKCEDGRDAHMISLAGMRLHDQQFHRRNFWLLKQQLVAPCSLI